MCHDSMTCANDSLSVGCIYTCDLMLLVNVKCRSSTKLSVSSAAVIAFAGADSTKWWVVIFSLLLELFVRFCSWLYVHWKSVAEQGLFQWQSICVGILTLRLEPGNWKWTELAVPYFQTLSVSYLDCIGVSSVN